MIPEPQTYEEAVAFEEENRRLAYLRLGRPLLGQPMGVLTWRQVIELSLVENAFLGTTEPSRGDVFQFLWRMHAFYRTPHGALPNLPSTAKRPSRFTSLLARWRCYVLASRVSPNLVEMPIRRWIDIAFQDAPATQRSGTDGQPSVFAPRIFWYDTLIQYFSDRRILPAEVIELPVALTFQILRLHYISIGDEFRCLPPSAKLKRFGAEE